MNTATSRGLLAGGALAAAVLLGLHWPGRPYATELLACFLAFTACVYPGGLLAQAQRRGTVAAELAVALLVLACAVLGLVQSALWLAAGYAAHGAWDWLHHAGRIATRVHRWFPPACALFDFVIAGFVAALVAV